jgi:predicted nucleic acid-binding protein
MKVVIEDANVLLDLVNGGILGTWLSLGYRNCTSHLVWNEVSQTRQREKVQPFIDSGLIRLRDIAANEWPEIYAFSNELGVSVPDSSVWLLARREGGILLTGDSKLRKAAQASDVEVRGVLWVLDELVDASRLLPGKAAEALRSIRDRGAFLPQDECDKRIAKWIGA